MNRELYQLVAIDRSGNQHIVELNNDNKNEKGSLEFLDNGTVRFMNQQHLAFYLFTKGKIPTTEVEFKIKYRYKEDKFLPIIYNDEELKLYLGFNESAKYDHILRFFRFIEIQLSKPYFFDYVVSENNFNEKQNNNGNYLNKKLFDDLIEYKKKYIDTGIYDNNKPQLQYSILSELINYKQFRTIYQFYKSYNQDLTLAAEKTSYENLPNIPDYIRHAYQSNGMDGVYSVVDRDDLESKGILNIDEIESKSKRI